MRRSRPSFRPRCHPSSRHSYSTGLSSNGSERPSRRWCVWNSPARWFRDEYYRRLHAVRINGDWEGWLEYFFDGVATIADEAVSSARDLFSLVADDRTRSLEHAGTSVAAVRLFELLPRHPIVSVAYVIKQLGVSKPTAGRAVEALEKAGVLVEITGKKRDRSWAYQGYLDRLRVGTDLDTPTRR